MKHAMMLWMALALPIALAACAPRMTGTQAQIDNNDGERAANWQALEVLTNRNADRATTEEEVPILPVQIMEPPPTPGELGEGAISREDLALYLHDGPPQLFQALSLTPVLSDSGFTGFRIDDISANGNPVMGSGLRTGDVVTAINGRDISRIDSFMTVWESMGTAERLQVDIIRANRPHTLAWTIN